MAAFSDGNDGVETVFDALHGHIDISDIYPAGGDQIRRIISAPFMQRLRRVKQLGFVSQNFLSAQHNRYSHALGTMHMMRKLLIQLDNENSSTFREALPAVRQLTEKGSIADSDDAAISQLKQHLLASCGAHTGYW